MSTQLNPQPPAPVRLITTTEGKFLSFDDLTARMKEDGPVDDILTVLKVGVENGCPERFSMRVALASFLSACAGEKV